MIEQSALLGGISRTESHNGYHFDIGGHRFFTKVPEVARLWETVGGAQFRTVKRRSRIYFDGHFYPYPLQLGPTLRQLGVVRSAGAVLSYAKARLFPYPEEHTFEQWTVNRFGRKLFEMFFRTYTEKVWGIPTSEIGADWAAQRIQNLSLIRAVMSALIKPAHGSVKTLIEEFHYPETGPGMMWQAFGEAIERDGGKIAMKTNATRIEHDGHSVTAVHIEDESGRYTLNPSAVISSMPLRTLIQSLHPAPPDAVLQAAANLKYRDFLIVVLIIDQDEVFDDNWIYIHTPEVRVGRIQNFKNWSMAMMADPTKTSLGMEYFCTLGDSLWTQTDADLIALAERELAQLGLAPGAKVIDATVIRQPKAYPVYDREYRQNLAVLKAYMAGFSNLQTIGRNGLHRYNNQDHSMLTGLLAALNLMGECHDVWEVNTERSYHETFMAPKPAQTASAPVLANP